MSQKHPVFSNQGHNKYIMFSTVKIRPAKQLMLSDYLRRVAVCRSTNITTNVPSKIQKCLSWNCKIYVQCSHANDDYDHTMPETTQWYHRAIRLHAVARETILVHVWLGHTLQTDL